MAPEQMWAESWRADPLGRAIADRHYNRQSIGAAQFVPPGRCVVLLADDGLSLWASSATWLMGRWSTRIRSIKRRRPSGVSGALA